MKNATTNMKCGVKKWGGDMASLLSGIKYRLRCVLISIRAIYIGITIYASTQYVALPDDCKYTLQSILSAQLVC